MTGRLIGVVGASGVGKDSVMAGMLAARPELMIARRVITRADGLGGEDYEAVTEAEFARREAAGEFCVAWRAHGLHYGIPSRVLLDVAAGREVLVNLSRSVLSEVNALTPGFLVLNVTARQETLAARLAGRGRESEAEIAKRLSRPTPVFPETVTVVDIPNDGDLSDTVARALRCLQPVRA